MEITGTELYSLDLLTRGDVKTGYIHSDSLGYKPVQYTAIDGLAVFEGDIILGTVAEMERRRASVENGSLKNGKIVRAIIRPDRQPWTKNIIPYEIEADSSTSGRIMDAIEHWKRNTPIKFVRRTTETAYVTFKAGDGCSSEVGMSGKQQFIYLSKNCGTGAVIHEIGHAVGLWHEQSRADRDNYVTINWNNIKESHKDNFNQHINDGKDVGTYDYGSIMHYGKDAFSLNKKPTISPTDPDAKIGQRDGLSQSDIMAVNFMYFFDDVGPITAIDVVSGDRDVKSPSGWTRIRQDLNGGAGGKYIYLCYQKGKGQPISRLKVIAGNKKNIEAPKGFTKLPRDLNAGSGGKYIYICYAKDKEYVPITNLAVITGDTNKTFPGGGYGLVRINQDLNQGAGGKYLYLCYQPDPSANVTVVSVKAGDSDKVGVPDDFIRVDIDLKMGVKGKFIYLYYFKGFSKPITDITFVKGDRDVPPPAGYTRVEHDVNEGAGGQYLYLCYQTGAGNPIIGLDVIYGNNSKIQPPGGYIRVEQDTNEGLEGKFVYVCYQKATAATR